MRLIAPLLSLTLLAAAAALADPQGAAGPVVCVSLVDSTLRVPPEPGTYTIAAAFFYGTEKGQPMGTVMHNGLAGPRGGSSGASGRIMFSEALKISVN